VPKTPYRRICESSEVAGKIKRELVQGYEKLNPAQLARQIVRLLKRLPSRPTSLSPLWQRNANHRLGRATGGDPQDPPPSGSMGAATTFSSAQAVSSQAGNLYGFSLSPAGSRNPSLHGFGFLGRCPGLERLKSQGSSLFIQYTCAFFLLFSHSFRHTYSFTTSGPSLPVILTIQPEKKLSLPAFRAEIHQPQKSKLLYPRKHCRKPPIRCRKFPTLSREEQPQTLVT